MQITVLVAALVAWAAVHSWLASSTMKAWAQKVLGPELSRGYRLAYNLFSAITLAPIAWLMWKLPDRVLYSIPVPWSFALLGAQAVAIAMAAVTLLQTNTLHFAGLAQILGRAESDSLVTTGFYGVVRHPLYLFGLILLWLSPHMSLNQLVLSIVLTAYLFVGATLEERRLVREFGNAYLEYRKKTPMIFPRLL